MNTKIWNVLFYVFLTLGPSLLNLAQHNFNSPAAESYSVPAQVGGKYGIGIAGLASLAGAAVAFHKRTAQAKQELPSVGVNAEVGVILDHLWVRLGRNATKEQFDAFKTMREQAEPQTSQAQGGGK